MRYTKKRQYFWSNEISYIVGLMASDGHLSKDGRHLDLTSKDIEQLTNFNKALGRNIKIGKKSSGDGKLAHRVQMSDVSLYDFLLEIGLTPNKSHTIGEISVPVIYYNDFLRGVFDGDGTSYGFWDKRWRSSYVFYTSFTSASIKFLEYIRDQNMSILNTGAGSLKPGSRAFKLNYSKRDSYIIYKAMYSNSHGLYLSRKRKRLDEFIEQDKSAKMK